MSVFDEGLKRYLTEGQLEQIRSVRIGIAGAGGLGSNCAMNLVRCGFSDFVIVDDDGVESSNLNRQFFFADQVGMTKVEAVKANLMKINPDLRVKAVCKKIDKETIEPLFQDCDVVIEAFDEAVFKKLIVETYMNSGKLLVAASGIGGWGKSDDIRITRIRDNFYMVGDSVSEVSDECPPMAPSVMIAAAKQADVVLDYILMRVD